jgi:hypothetical protein
MLHAARWISNLAFIIVACGVLQGCATGEGLKEDKVAVRPKPLQQLFYAPFDQVWRAAHAVLKYPIANENPDAGYIETEYIKGIDGFLPPDKTKPPSAGIRYKIIMIFAKGQVEGRVSTRVTIEKKMEVLRDFFSEPESMQSDELEEKIIFYRIERELIVYDTLKKVPS